MIKPFLVLTTLLFIAIPALAELPRVTLTDLKDRKLDVTVLSKTKEVVKVRTIKGAYHTIKLAQLSEESRKIVAGLTLPNEYLILDLDIQKKDGKTVRNVKHEGQGEWRREVESGKARTETISGTILAKNRHQTNPAEECVLTVYLAGHVDRGGYRLLRKEVFQCRELSTLDETEFELTPFKNAYHVKGDKTKVGNEGLRYAGHIIVATVKGKTVSQASKPAGLIEHVGVLSKTEPIYPLKK